MDAPGLICGANFECQANEAELAVFLRSAATLRNRITSPTAQSPPASPHHPIAYSRIVPG